MVTAPAAPRLYEAVASLQEERPQIYQRMVRDGVQNYNRLGIHDPQCRDPHQVEGPLQYQTDEHWIAGGQTITHILRIMNSDIEGLERLIDEGRAVNARVEDQFRPSVRDGLQHAIEADRYTFTCVWPPDREDREERHVCTEHPAAQKLGDILLDDWRAVVRYARDDLVNQFEEPSVGAASRKTRKEKFHRSAEAFVRMGNCVDFGYSEAVHVATNYFQDVRSIPINHIKAV